MKNQTEFNVEVFNQRIDYQEDSMNFMRLYLKKNKEGYRIYCLGKSGEPKKKVKIELSFTNDLKTISNQKQYSLMTNSEGYVRLGKLKNINEIKAYCDSDECSWPIIKDQTIQYQC